MKLPNTSIVCEFMSNWIFKMRREKAVLVQRYSPKGLIPTTTKYFKSVSKL